MSLSLKINVRSIKEDPQALTVDLPAGELELGPEEGIAQGPARVEVSLYRIGEKLFVKGSVRVTVRLTCSRCLTEFDSLIEAPFLFVAVPSHHPDLLKQAEEAGEDGQAMIEYVGDQIDLLPELRSALLLALPMKPLCREDCPGLCPACGERFPCSCNQ